MKTRWFQGLSLMIAAMMLVTACTAFQAEGPKDSDPVRGDAEVDEVELLIMESFPVQVAAIARGHLRDGCTEIDEVTTTFDEGENTFYVEITTVRDPDAMCTQALVPFEERIDLEVRGLSAGTYTVDVNGVQETFTFDVDNELQE